MTKRTWQNHFLAGCIFIRLRLWGCCRDIYQAGQKTPVGVAYSYAWHHVTSLLRLVMCASIGTPICAALHLMLCASWRRHTIVESHWDDGVNRETVDCSDCRARRPSCFPKSIWMVFPAGSPFRPMVKIVKSWHGPSLLGKEGDPSPICFSGKTGSLIMLKIILLL